MPLFFIAWPDVASVLVDATNEKHARELAGVLAAETGAGKPERVIEWPAGIYVAEVDAEGNVSPMDLPADILIALEDGAATFEDAAQEAHEAAAEEEPEEQEDSCPSMARDDADRIVECMKGKTHEPPHRSPCGLVWE